MLCPAIKDPFDGPYYRLIAVCHQSVLCPCLCKLYCIFFTPNTTKPTTSDKISNNHVVKLNDKKLENGGDRFLADNNIQLEFSNNKLNGGEKID